MHQQQVLNDILAKRRDRAIAIVLGVKERECDKFLPDVASKKLRKVILDQMNDLTDVALDILKSLDSSSGTTLNEVWLDKLEEIRDAIGELKA